MTRYLIPITSYPHDVQVSTDASEAAAPQVVESTAAAQTPVRTTCTLKPRPYYQSKSVQDSLDFDKILLDGQLPRQLPTSSKKRNVSLTAFGALVLAIALTPVRKKKPSFSAQLPESGGSLSDQLHRRVSVHYFL